MGTQAKRSYAALGILILLVLALYLVTSGKQKAQAEDSRVVGLTTGAFTYNTGNPGTSSTSVIASFTSDETSDFRLHVQTYVTPSGGSEAKRLAGDAYQDDTGHGVVCAAQPLSFYNSGDQVRAVFTAYDNQGNSVYASSLSMSIP